ncbi:MAG: 16S rRNA (adenine(1518)-N(6)/adenine(1519)-N(6))-dimethyltransferase RsmA [Clostridia bacterium]|nr:16S rRNA (adenine(1518)-N(6)/adenine(1519)-N(6))-dimethyltransferase RsmA [Clostridia bacterium]
MEIESKNFSFKKNFGQNFIYDENLLSEIVFLAEVTEDDNVLEIGAGAGTLTAKLAEKAKKVVSYEIDKTLTEHLEKLSKQYENLTIYIKDGLKASIKEIEEVFNGENYILVANLPYYITTPLIFKFIEETQNVKSMTVMIQKEVAERFCADPNSKDYGIATIMLNYHADVKYLKTINRTFFNPSPKVDSALIQVIPKLNKSKAKDNVKFKKLVQSAFSMRRKTLINNLTKNFNAQKSDVISLLQKLGKLETARAEELSINDFIYLSDNLN